MQEPTLHNEIHDSPRFSFHRDLQRDTEFRNQIEDLSEIRAHSVIQDDKRADQDTRGSVGRIPEDQNIRGKRMCVG